MLFAAATYPIPAAEPGQSIPCAWLGDLPPDGALVTLIEWYEGTSQATEEDFPVQPERFSLDDGFLRSRACTPQLEEDPPEYVIPFQANGRFFWALVSLGQDATEPLRADVLDALSSISVEQLFSSAPQESPSALPTEPELFVPATYGEGGRVVMPVTFPDGSTADLVYAAELDLAGMSVQPYSSGYGPGFARDFLVIYGPVEEVIGRYGEAELLAEYEDGQGGTVGFWRLPPDGVYLAFQFGSWAVLVYDYGSGDAAISDEDRALWATNFRGQDGEDGFLVLETDPPLRLARAGEHAGPELEFWSRAGDFSAVLLFVGECTPFHEGEGGFEHIQMVNGLAVSRESDDFANWCIPDASMTVHVYQEPGDTFIDAVLSGLEVRNVKLAS